MSLLTIRNLTVTYGDAVRAVDGVDLDVVGGRGGRPGRRIRLR